MSADTWKLARFADGKNGDGRPYWYFLTDQCRHCLSPGCMAEVERDEIIQDEKTGPVLFTPKTKNLDFKATLDGCPYNFSSRSEIRIGFRYKLQSLCYGFPSDPGLTRRSAYVTRDIMAGNFLVRESFFQNASSERHAFAACRSVRP